MITVILRCLAAVSILSVDVEDDSTVLEAFLAPYKNRPQPAPFNKVAVFEDILSAEECAAVIKLANEYGEVHGWTTARHKRYPTTDIPVEVRAGHVMWAECLPQLLAGITK
jgi:hypothetical protein